MWFVSLFRFLFSGASTFCLACGHGGHTQHMLDWFRNEAWCPTGCGCECERESLRVCQQDVCSLSPITVTVGTKRWWKKRSPRCEQACSSCHQLNLTDRYPSGCGCECERKTLRVCHQDVCSLLPSHSGNQNMMNKALQTVCKQTHCSHHQLDLTNWMQLWVWTRVAQSLPTRYLIPIAHYGPRRYKEMMNKTSPRCEQEWS